MFIPLNKTTAKLSIKKIEDKILVQYLESKNILPINITNNIYTFIDCDVLNKEILQYESIEKAVKNE